MKPIEVAIADKHKLYREGIKQLLLPVDEIELIFGVGSSEELLKKLKPDAPDLVLLDLDLPEMGGLETFLEIKRDIPDIKVIMMTRYEDDHLVIRLIEQGVNGFLLKNLSGEELKKAIISVHQQGYYFRGGSPEEVLDSIKSSPKPLPHIPGAKIELSETEQKVLELISEGLSDKEIGEKLTLRKRTIE